jgi:kynureninase
MIILPSHIDAPATVAALRSRQLYCDARGATLRLSPGAVTTADDVGALCAALDELLACR